MEQSVKGAATLCNTLQRTATHRNTSQHTATHLQGPLQMLLYIIQKNSGLDQQIKDIYDRNSIQGISSTYVTTHCNTLQQNATHYNTMQHTATKCNKMQHIYAQNSIPGTL